MGYEEVDTVYSRVKQDNAFSQLHPEPYPTPFVPGEGNADDPVAFVVGEAPGALESVRHRPFVGSSGRVQRQLMAAARLQADPLDTPDDNASQANCWLTNVLHYRPPGNRTPTRAERAAAKPYLLDEWCAVGAPNLIVAVGRSAAVTLTHDNIPFMRLLGQPLARKVRGTDHAATLWLWLMLHPAYGLRFPHIQKYIEQDWHALGEWRRKEGI